MKESMLNELVLEELRMDKEYDEGILSRKESELTSLTIAGLLLFHHVLGSEGIREQVAV